MTIYYSREESESAGWAIYKYKGGAPANIGDLIELDSTSYEPHGIPKGSKGTVVCFYDYYIGVDFGFRPTSNATSFNDILPELTGHIINQTGCKLLEAGKTLTESEHIDKLCDSISKETKSLMIDGQVYTLTLKPNEEANSIKKELINSVGSRLRTIRTMSQREIERVKQESKLLVPMPKLPKEEAFLHNIHLANSGQGLIEWLLPFKYAPKYVIERAGDRRHPTHEIPEKLQKALAGNCIVAITTEPTNGHVTGAGLWEQGTDGQLRMFPHYHGGGNDCLGSLIAFKTKPVRNSTEAVAFRDEIQHMMEVINGKSIMHSDPNRDGVPSFPRLFSQCKPLDKPASWTATLTTDNALGKLKVGDLVRIIDVIDEWSRENIGAIGKIVKVHDVPINDRSAYRFAVEFLFNFKAGHSIDDSGRGGNCYNFPALCVEPAPEGTARTRVSRDPADESLNLTSAGTPIVGTPEPARPFGTVADAPRPATTGERQVRDCPANVRGEKFPERDYADAICTRCGQGWGAHAQWLCSDQLIAWLENGVSIPNETPFNSLDSRGMPRVSVAGGTT